MLRRMALPADGPSSGGWCSGCTSSAAGGCCAARIHAPAKHQVAHPGGARWRRRREPAARPTRGLPAPAARRGAACRRSRRRLRRAAAPGPAALEALRIAPAAAASAPGPAGAKAGRSSSGGQPGAPPVLASRSLSSSAAPISASAAALMHATSAASCAPARAPAAAALLLAVPDGRGAGALAGEQAAGAEGQPGAEVGASSSRSSSGPALSRVSETPDMSSEVMKAPL